MIKKSQVWYMDFLIGLLVIIVISVIFFKTINEIFYKQDVFDALKKEGDNIASSLLSEPYPIDGSTWATGTGRIGITQNQKIDNNALCNLENLDYEYSKYMLGTGVNYAVHFLNKENVLIPQPDQCIGNGIIGPSYVTSLSALDQVQGNKIQMIRFVYYDYDEDGRGEIVKMVVSLWQ